MKPLLALAFLLLAGAHQARAQALVADLTSHLVAITTGFTGTDIVLFGAIDGEGDILAVVRGPEAPMTIWRKEPILGIWLNRSAVTFSAVPQFYAVAATRTIAEMAQTKTLSAQQIGIDHLILAPQGRPSPEKLADFRAALVKGKIADGLWLPAIGTVKFIGGRLFRTTFALPANVPTGRYQVTTYLVRRGEVVAAQATPLLVSQLGISADIARFAYRHAFWYSVVAVLLAVVAGWGASLIFRRR